MKIGRKQSRYNLVALDKHKKKSKSFVIDDVPVKDVYELADLIKTLLTKHFQEKD